MVVDAGSIMPLGRCHAPGDALVVFALAASVLPLDQALGQMAYPPTRTVDQVDDYHGTKVPDPYRWLENDTSAATAAWVQAQNALTFDYLAKIPVRAKLRRRMRRSCRRSHRRASSTVRCPSSA